MVDGIPLYNTDNPGTAHSMKLLACHYHEQGEFEDDRTATKLIKHLIMVNDSELHGQGKQVINQLRNFKVLLEHQKGNEDISARASHMLNNYADYLLDKWSGE